MDVRAGRFRRTDRLLHSRDFQRVGRSRRRAAAREFVLLVASGRGEPPSTRLGLTVSRKVGGAVVRNRVKRRIREWYRRYGDPLKRGLDMVVIARASAAELDSQELRAGLDRLLERVAAGSGRAR